MGKEDSSANLLKKHASLFHAFLFLLAIVIAGAAGITVSTQELWQQTYSNIISSVAAALMVVTLLFLLEKIFAADSESQVLETQFQCQARNLVIGSDVCGLESVYDRMGNFGSQRHWIELIDSASQSVDVMGRALYGWTQSDDTIDVIVKKINVHEVRFRWLIMHPENHFLPKIIEHDNLIGVELTDKLKVVCQLFQKIQDLLPDNRKDHFQIRQYKNVPLYFSTLAVDDKMYINHYLSSASSENAPMLKLRGVSESWPATYRREFDSVWENATVPPCDLS